MVDEARRAKAETPKPEFGLAKAGVGFKADSFAQIVDDEGFLPNIDPKVALARKNSDMFPIDLNTATYYEMVRIPHIGPVTARKIVTARKTMRIRHSSDLERIIGANLTRRVNQYVDLRNKRLTEFSKSK